MKRHVVVVGIVLGSIFQLCYGLQGKVEPERELTEIPSHDKTVSAFDILNSDPSPTSSGTPQKENNTPPLDSIVDTRQLDDECMTFAFSAGTNGDIEQDDYLDVNGTGTTLDEYCDLNNCCNQNDYYDYDDGYYEEWYYDDLACRYWSTDPTVQYTVCPHSCVGPSACWGVARNALSDSSIFFSSGSCSDTSGSGYSCFGMATLTTKKLNVVVGEGSCTNTEACYRMATNARNLEKLSISSGSCTDRKSCYSAATQAKSLKQLIIDDNQCQSSGDCFGCGSSSTFSEALQLTEECCNEVTGEYYYFNFDTACQYSEPIPSSIPSTSNQPSTSSQPSSTCIDNENATFYLIRNPNKNVKCSWLSKHKTNTDKRIAEYCDLPRVKTICKSTCSFCTCVDDESFTFELINISNPNKKNKTCNWLTVNKKKRAIRIARYCTEDFDNGAVMNACTKSCGLCE